MNETGQTRKRTGKRLLIGGIASLGLLAGYWLVSSMVVVHRTCDIIDEVHKSRVKSLILGGASQWEQKVKEAVGRLGGPERAAARIKLYLWLPDRVTGEKKQVVWSILPHCGRPAVPALMDGLDNPDPQVRTLVAAGLGQIGPDAAEAIPALVQAVEDDNDAHPADPLCLALTRIGARAVPALVEALKSPKPRVRSVAAFALGEMGAKARAAIPALEQRLSDRVLEVRCTAAFALWEVSGDADKTVPILIPALRGPGRSEQTHAVLWLGLIGPEAKDAVATLLEVLRSDDGTLRFLAAQALGRIRPPADVAVPALIEALKKAKYRREWIYASEALGQYGPDAKDAVSALLRAFEGAECEAPVAAAKAIWKITGDFEMALPGFVLVLKHEDAYWREIAVKALGEIGPPARKAISALEKALKDEEEDVCRTAAEALARIRGEAPATDAPDTPPAPE